MVGYTLPHLDLNAHEVAQDWPFWPRGQAFRRIPTAVNKIWPCLINVKLFILHTYEKGQSAERCARVSLVNYKQVYVPLFSNIFLARPNIA